MASTLSPGVLRPRRLARGWIGPRATGTDGIPWRGDVSCPDEDTLQLLVSGRLPLDDARGARLHLDACSDCRAIVAALGRDDVSGAEAREAIPGVEAKALAPGARVGRYIVLEPLGAGAMGLVLLAYDPTLDRRVALKLIGAGRSLADASIGERLPREARALARLTHPNVVAVYDAGTFEATVFVAMEYVPGGTLRRWLATPRRWREILDVFLAAGQGLAAAHAAGLIHRDFKPDNVLVGDDGDVRVADFGLAHIADVAAGPGHEPAAPGEGVPTVMRGVVGTPAYLAPEIFAGDVADARSDIFSFCVALYEALYGERPYPGQSLEGIQRAVAEGALRPAPRNAPVPAWLRRVVTAGLRRDPRERPRSMQALLAALRRDPGRVLRRRAAAAAALAGVAAVLVLAIRSAGRGQQLCRAGDEEAAAAWSPARQLAIERAFRRTGAGFADTAARAVASRFSAWTTFWAAMHRDACEASRLRGEQSDEMLDLRMSCLRDELGQAGAAAELLAGADVQVVEHFERALDLLPPVDRCARVPQLRSEDREPAGATAVAIRRLREDLARARSAAVARSPAAHEALERVVAGARGAGYRPLLASALLALGEERLDTGALEPGETALDEAALQGSISGRHDVAVSALTDLVQLTGYDQPRLEEALRLSDMAAAAAARAGGEGEARRLEATGLVLLHKGRIAEALPMLERAVALREKDPGDDPIALASALDRLAQGLVRSDRNADALPISERSLAITEREYGSRHPLYARRLSNYGNVLALLGRYDEVEPVIRRVVAIQEATLGREHWDLGKSLTNLGHVLRQRRRCGDALEPLRRAEAIREPHLPRDAQALANTLAELGACLVDLDRPAEALPVLRRVLTLSPAPDTLADAQFHLARATLLSGGSRDEARALASSAHAAYVALRQAPDQLAVEAWQREHP
jgi:eukaryotic-like serine/threonine-protein kinase